jgi:hypothetical protein
LIDEILVVDALVVELTDDIVLLEVEVDVLVDVLTDVVLCDVVLSDDWLVLVLVLVDVDELELLEDDDSDDTEVLGDDGVLRLALDITELLSSSPTYSHAVMPPSPW